MPDPPVGHPRLVKLVRDRVRDFLPDTRVAYRQIEDADVALEAVRKKLGEEAFEYALKPSIGELADILETARALAQHDLKVSWREVEEEAALKHAERGGFEGLIGMWAWSTAPGRHEGEHAQRCVGEHEWAEWGPSDEPFLIERGCRRCPARETQRE